LVSLYEKGKSNPTVDDLKRIADVLDVEVESLCYGYYKFLLYPCTEKMKEICSENNLQSADLGALLGVTAVAVNCWKRGKHVVSRRTWEELKSLGFL